MNVKQSCATFVAVDRLARTVINEWGTFICAPSAFICVSKDFWFASLLDAELLAQPLRHHHQHEEREDEEHAEGRELDVLAVLPQLPDHDRDHLGARAVEQDRGG